MTAVVDDPLIDGMAIRPGAAAARIQPTAADAVSGVPAGLRRGGDGRRVEAALVAAGGRADQRAARTHVRRRGRRDGQSQPPPPSSWRPRWPTRCSAAWSPWSSSRAGPGTPAWRTSGCTSTPRAPSTGSACVDPTLRVLPDDPCVTRGRRRRGGANCPARPRWPPGSRTAATARWPRCSHGCTRSAAARSASRRCGTRSGSAIVVAATQVPHAGGLQRGRRHAPRAGGARRAGRLRAAGAGPDCAAAPWPRTGQDIQFGLNRREGLAKLGSLAYADSTSRRTDRAGVLRAAETPGPLEGEPRVIARGSPAFRGSRLGVDKQRASNTSWLPGGLLLALRQRTRPGLHRGHPGRHQGPARGQTRAAAADGHRARRRVLLVIESIASTSAYVWLAEHGGGNVVGVNNNTDFLRAISVGHGVRGVRTGAPRSPSAAVAGHHQGREGPRRRARAGAAAEPRSRALPSTGDTGGHRPPC